MLPGERRANADADFIGWFREIGIGDPETACEVAWDGPRTFAVSLAPAFATADGRAQGTSRAVAAVVISLAGRRTTGLGKPTAEALRAATRRLELAPADLAVVGDDLTLAVPMAHRGEVLAIAVHSGLGGAETLDARPAAHPRLAVQDVAEP